MCHIRSGAIRAILIICLSCKANLIFADTATFWAERDKTMELTPSLRECTEVISKGIRFDYEKFSSFYIYDESQWLINMTEGVFVCRYIGKLIYNEGIDIDNMSIGEKLVAFKDKCDRNGEIHEMCIDFLGIEKLIGKDIDMCLQENPLLVGTIHYVRNCVNSVFPN